MLLPVGHVIRGFAARTVTLGVLVLALAFSPSSQSNLGLPSASASAHRGAGPVAQQIVSAFTVQITGTRAIGHRITATLSPKPAAGSAVRYLWLRNGVPLAGPSAARTILLTDTGAPLSVRVTVAQSGSSRTASASAGTIGRPNIKRASAKTLAAGHVASGTRAWYTTSTTARWFQVTANGTSRMFLLKGSRLRAFRNTGGLSAHGLPVRTRCGLPGGGCLTHYTHGTIYTAPHGVRGTTTVRGTRGDLIAVEYSQVGYTERLGYYALHNTKYNEFVQGSGAWCSFIHSWAAYYAGLPKVAPRYSMFHLFRNHLQATAKKLRLPKVGAFVLLSVNATYSHVALVVATSKDRHEFEIIEGNWGGKVGTRFLAVGGANSPQQFWYPTGY